VPDWLSLSKEEFKGTIMRIPTRDEIQPIANEQRWSNFIPVKENQPRMDTDIKQNKWGSIPNPCLSRSSVVKK